MLHARCWGKVGRVYRYRRPLLELGP